MESEGTLGMQAELVNEEGKEAFAAVMEKMCSHQLKDVISAMTLWMTGSSETNERSEDSNRNMPMGMPIVRVGNDSMEWILHKGAFLVPTPAVRWCLWKLRSFKMW